MKTMTATDVSRGFSKALDAVENGAEIRIMRGGHSVARLIPETRHATWAEVSKVIDAHAPLAEDLAERIRDGLSGVDMTVRDPWGDD